MADVYFKCYPSDFLSGVLGLEPDEIAVYTVVLMMIYDRGEPIGDDANTLAWRCRMNVRRFKNVLDRLVQLKKLTRENGFISNLRAEKEIRSRQEASEKQSRNASARWVQPEKKPNEISAPVMPPHSDRNALLELELELEKEGNLKVSCPKQVRTKAAYSEDYEVFWKSYPTDSNMSKKEGYTEWRKLSPEDRSLALKSLVGFNAYCTSHSDYRPIHVNRYLSKRRFEGHAEAAEKITATVFVRVGTPAWRAWEAHYRRTQGRGPPVSEKHQGWSFPSEYPELEEATAA